MLRVHAAKSTAAFLEVEVGGAAGVGGVVEGAQRRATHCDCRQQGNGRRHPDRTAEGNGERPWESDHVLDTKLEVATTVPLAWRMVNVVPAGSPGVVIYRPTGVGVGVAVGLRRRCSAIGRACWLRRRRDICPDPAASPAIGSGSATAIAWSRWDAPLGTAHPCPATARACPWAWHSRWPCPSAPYPTPAFLSLAMSRFGVDCSGF